MVYLPRFVVNPSCSLLCSCSHRLRRWLKGQDNAAVSASRAHEPAFQTGEGEIPATCPNQRVYVQLLPIDARTRVRAVIDHASGTAGSYPPAMGEGIAEGLDFHENKIRTFVRAVDDTLAGRYPTPTVA
jgi:hypothetical protein